MGACSSCLGRGRDHGLSDGDESSRLLFDDPHGNQYGSFGDSSTGVAQADPQEAQKETEALQQVVTQTSNHLVDIFTMVPQQSPSTPSAGLSAHDGRFVRYQDVLAQLSKYDHPRESKQDQNESNISASEGWLSEEEDVEDIKATAPVKSEGIGPLLGGFADVTAESALE